MAKIAKAKKTKTTKTQAAKAPKVSFKTPAQTLGLAHKGLRAYVGLYGAAYERALPVYDAAVKNYEAYAARGEKMENLASTFAKDARKNVAAFATKRFEKRAAQLRSFLPSAANDRVVELETEIAKLNKKIVSLAKPAPKKTKSAPKKPSENVTIVTNKAPKAA